MSAISGWAAPRRTRRPGRRGATQVAERELGPLNAIVRAVASETRSGEGTAAHARFAALRDGMTVAEYVAAAGPVAAGTLRKAIRRGHVRLEPPAAQENRDDYRILMLGCDRNSTIDCRLSVRT